MHAGATQEAATSYDLLRPYEGRWIKCGRDAVAPLGPVAYYLGVLAACLSRFDAAAQHFEVALEATERIGARPFLALTQGAYGAMLARRSASVNRRRARQLLADALKTAQERGMNQLYNYVVASQPGLPADPVLTQGQLKPAGPLTPREREVAELVAHGLTNREIAARLYLSERTAQNHVQHILTKLDLSNRSQIAVWITSRR
ncbi:MAG: LuxR family transcriptional regulator [Actinomycetota bacterium]|nr:LuxR family transcriptional regulator [Actinomycetota bacterium]